MEPPAWGFSQGEEVGGPEVTSVYLAMWPMLELGKMLV